MMGALIGTMLPDMLLSGFIFPLESMRTPLRAISYVVPARWFVLVARGIMLKGLGSRTCGPPRSSWSRWRAAADREHAVVSRTAGKLVVCMRPFRDRHLIVRFWARNHEITNHETELRCRFRVFVFSWFRGCLSVLNQRIRSASMRRILFLARAEVLHVVRDRATLAQSSSCRSSSC